MANYIGQIEKAYNAIYDYLMNKCEDKDFYQACIKNDIKNLSKSTIHYSGNDLYDVMLSLKETIQQNTAKESGNGDLRKAMLNVLKRTNDVRPLLKKAYVEDGYTMVCDSYVFIRTNRDVDIPKHESDVQWLNWKGFMPNTAEMQETTLPSLSELKQHIKLNKNNPRYLDYYGKNATLFWDVISDDTGEVLTRINAKYLLDMLEAMSGTDYKCYIGKGSKSRTSVVVIENTDGECAFGCPMRVGAA